jgi:hypothetical protein
MSITQWAAALLLAMAPTICQSEPPPPRQQSSVRSVDNDRQNRRRSALILDDGRRFQTTLYQVKVLAELHAQQKLPYIVMVGRGCINCDEHDSIYIHSPSDGPMQDEAHLRRYPYPGRLVSYLDGKTPVSQIRLFIGACVADYNDAMVWYSRERTDEGPFQSSVVIVRVNADTVQEVLLKSQLPPVADVLQRVRQGVCREIPGVDGHSEP